ncbi:glycosyltransferase family 2 protein [Cupriavidus basilensis]
MAIVYVIDNGSGEATVDELQLLAVARNIQVIPLGTNRGIAAGPQCWNRPSLPAGV